MNEAPSADSLREMLRYGDDAIALARAEAWAMLVRETVRWLRLAGEAMREDAAPSAYRRRPDWLGSGRHSVRGRTVRLPEEDTVTDALVRTAMDIYQSLDRDDELRRLRLYMVDQRPRREDRLGARSRPTDIQVASLDGNLDLRVEAKRLLGGAHLGTYVGADGLMRFAEDPPYAAGPAGMMLGYTFRHDDAKWWSDLSARCRDAHGIHLEQVASSPSETLRVTRIRSRPDRAVIVVHLLLAFESEPSARAIDLAARTDRPRKQVSGPARTF